MSNIRFMSVGDAVRANESKFYAAVERGIESWIKNSTDEEIHSAIFVSTDKNAESELELAA